MVLRCTYYGKRAKEGRKDQPAERFPFHQVSPFALQTAFSLNWKETVRSSVYASTERHRLPAHMGCFGPRKNIGGLKSPPSVCQRNLCRVHSVSSSRRLPASIRYLLKTPSAVRGSGDDIDATQRNPPASRSILCSWGEKRNALKVAFTVIPFLPGLGPPSQEKTPQKSRATGA